MKHIKKHGGIHTLNKGGMYDAIMKFMGGGKYLKEGGTDFGNLSMKAGIDKNPEVTYADKIAGATMNEKGKGGRVYRMGGVNEMEHGGGLKVLIKAMQEGGMLNMMEHGGVHKYPNGGVHNPEKSVEEGGEMPEGETFVLNNKTAKDPGFQDFLRSVGGEYYEMAIPEMDSRVERGTPGTVGFSDYASFLRDPANRGKELAVNPRFFDMEEAQSSPGTFGRSVPQFEREGQGRGGRYEGSTYAEMMAKQAARHASNKDLERRYNEYLMKQRQGQRVGPRESVEYTPSGLTNAERKLLDSFNQ
tara:strand:+ start:447 stop:1352 length:906 start_codon:yes stop_codon:yes gene_type:complete